MSTSLVVVNGILQSRFSIPPAERLGPHLDHLIEMLQATHPTQWSEGFRIWSRAMELRKFSAEVIGATVTVARLRADELIDG